MNMHPRTERLSDPPLIETVYAPLLHCDGVGPTLIHDGSLHFVLWHDQLGSDGQMERVLAVRVVLRLDHAREVVNKLANTLDGSALK